MTDAVARRAVEAFRAARSKTRDSASSRSVAREFGVPVTAMHHAAGCNEGHNCTGPRCRL